MSSSSSISSSRSKSLCKTIDSRDYGSNKYSTILVRARSNVRNSNDDLSSPVDLLITSGPQKPRENYPSNFRKENNFKSTRNAETEYHSDKYFAQNFLNNNPKLEQMVQKIEK